MNLKFPALTGTPSAKLNVWSVIHLAVIVAIFIVSGRVSSAATSSHEIPVATERAFHLAGNGSERGGGDEIVADFRDVERSIRSEIESWGDSHIQTSELLDELTVYRLDADPKPSPTIILHSDGFWIHRSQPIAYFLGAAWKQKKSALTRIELESFVLRLKLSALGKKNEALVQQYAERTRDAAQWKESKAQAIAVALREYQASQEIFRPSHYLRFRSVKILLETNLDYLRCQKSGEFVTLRLSESEAACARWKIFASERMKLLSPSQAATRLTQAPLTESIGYAWISDRIESYLNRLHSATDVAAVPVTSLLSNLEKFCASDNYPASQAKCLIQYYDQEVRELDGRLKAGTQAIDLAFDELSSELASQVRAP